jgi:signal transduction histidine kinase/CheY-like chemotaxis protein/HPt (histidine-containing phosphotransfer) domain-containing protein
MEAIRKSLHISGKQAPGPWLHLPFIIFSLTAYSLYKSSFISVLLGGLILTYVFLAAKTADKLSPESKAHTRAGLFMGLGITLAGVISRIKPEILPLIPGCPATINSSLPCLEAFVVFIICAIILSGRYRVEKRLHDLASRTQVLNIPILFLASIIVLSFSSAKIFVYMQNQEKNQIETHLDSQAEGLLKLINQRIQFARTASKILADSPIMAQYIEDRTPENVRLLDSFLASYHQNNPDSICYLMDAGGLVHAASSRRDIFVGKSLAFRNYFKESMAGKNGTLIDVGQFTNQLGFYSSFPVFNKSRNEIIGVCSVKSNLIDLENYLKLYHPALLVNSENMIFLASDQGIVGKRLLIPSARASANASSTSIFTFSSDRFAHVIREIETEGWRVLVLGSSLQRSDNKIWLYTTIILITFLLLTLLHGAIIASESKTGFRMAQEQVRLVFYHAPETILIISSSSLKILAANNSMLRQFNLSEGFSGRNYRDLLPPLSNTNPRKSCHDATEKVFKHERDFIRTDKTIFTAEVTGSQITFDGEKAILLLLHDISPHKQIELELRAAKNAAEAANAQRSRFFANASHEIRTPITAIIGLTELARTMCSNEEQKTVLDLIKTSEKSLLTLLSDILDLARIEAGKISIQNSTFCLSELLSNLIKLVRYRVGDKPVETLLEIETPCPDFIVSDADRIRQILLNLLDNAAKFTQKGQIRLKASIDQSNEQPVACFEIADTGPGIPEKVKSELFHPFVSPDPLKRDTERGAGLGLAISKQIIELMNGSVSYNSTISGTIFSIRIPVMLSSQENLPAPVGVLNNQMKLLKDRRPLRFLVADDNDINLFLATSIIEKFGGISDCAKDGIETLEKIRSHAYDALLIDIQMPRLDGIEAIKSLRRAQETRNLPIIAISAFASEPEKQKAISAGADIYISKPYFPDDLLTAIRTLLKTDSLNEIQPVQQRESHARSDISGTLKQIDLKELEIRVLKKPENIIQIRDIFHRRSETLLTELDSHISAHDVQKLRETAHSIKGLAGMLAAARVFTLAKEIEDLSRDGHFAEACEKIPLLKTFIKEIKQDLELLTCNPGKNFI